MTFSHKVRKIFQRDTYHLRRLRQGYVRKKELTVEGLLAGIDPGAIEQVRALVAEENPNDVFWTKYLDFEKWLALNIRYVKQLELDKNPVGDVLDLGCGGGFFLVACRAIGARVLGMDLDKDRVLNETIRLFGLERVTWKLRAFVKLPDMGRRFDLITAFMVCFNFPPKGGYWGPREWDYFLNDLLDSQLRPEGRVVLSLNKQPDGNEYDDVLKAYFESREGVAKGKRIVFTEAGLRRTYSPALLASSPSMEAVAAVA